jgi:hypothetical protein
MIRLANDRYKLLAQWLLLKVYLTDGALIQMRSNNLAPAQAEALFYG